jgi:hypothetical protein
MARDLLVPGTGGNKLLLDDQDLGWPSGVAAQGWLAGRTGFSVGLDGVPIGQTQLTDRLSMEYADQTSWQPTKSSCQAGSAIAAGEILDLVYNQFGGATRFGYDFRADIRETGRLLMEFLSANRPAGDRWRILAHSQGGLVVAAASKLWARSHGDDDRAFSSLVSHVAFVGVPFYGTVNAAEALVNGEQLSSAFAANFRKVARTWPALHQMLPVWPGSVRLPGGGGTTVDADFNCLDPRAWAGQQVDPNMLARAQATRDEFLDNPVSRMMGVKVRIFMARAWKTRNHVLVNAGQVLLPPAAEPGDTLVPCDTTFGNQGQAERAVTVRAGGVKDTMRHFALCNDNFFSAAVKSLFAE